MAALLSKLGKTAAGFGAAALFGYQQQQINGLKAQNANLTRKVDTLAHNAFLTGKLNTVLATAALQRTGKDVKLYGDSAVTVGKSSYHPHPALEDMTAFPGPLSNVFMLEGRFPGIRDNS